MATITSRSNPHQLLTITIEPTQTTAAAAATSTTDHHARHHHCLSITTRSIIPTLGRFHAGYFRVCLSLASQALLWKSLIEPPIIRTSQTTLLHPTLHHVFHHLHPSAFISLWSFSLLTLTIFSLLYLFRCLFLLHLVKAEFLHHVGVNYLFAPWIAWLLLLQCAPGIHSGLEPYLGAWWFLVLPMVVLDLKIYGRWFTTKGHKHKLTVVANPTCQMTVIGNLVGSRAAAQMGCKETAMFMFSVGLVHYLVIFVTLYQSRDNLPAVPKPVFFLFFATPAVACLAWTSIAQSFDTLAKMLFFLSLFLFMSLVGRGSLFKKAMRRYNVAWWAYPFPITVLALAATQYAHEAKHTVADVLMLLFVIFSLLLTFIMLLVTLFITAKCFIFHHDHHDVDDHDNDDDDNDCDVVVDYDDPDFMIYSTTNSYVMSPPNQQLSIRTQDKGQQRCYPSKN